MYSRPRFLEELHAIREEMSRECDYDMDLFAQVIHNNQPPSEETIYNQRSFHRPPLRQPKKSNSSNEENI